MVLRQQLQVGHCLAHALLVGQNPKIRAEALVAQLFQGEVAARQIHLVAAEHRQKLLGGLFADGVVQQLQPRCVLLAAAEFKARAANGADKFFGGGQPDNVGDALHAGGQVAASNGGAVKNSHGQLGGGSL